MHRSPLSFLRSCEFIQASKGTAAGPEEDAIERVFYFSTLLF